MNNTTKTFLIILLLLVIAAGAYFFLEEEINTFRESSPWPDSSQQADSKPSVEEQLSDRADTFSVSGEQAELFSKVVFNPFYLNPGETQQLFLKLHNPEQVEKAIAKVEDGTGSKKLTLEKMETADMGVVFTAEWTPKQVRGGETYPVEFSYTTEDGQNELTLHWEVEQQTSLIDQMLASLIPKVRAADTCSELENNAEGNIRITENCQIGPDREISWGVNNGGLTVDAGVTLTLVSNTTLDVNGNLTVGGLIQMNKNTTIRFEQGKSVLPDGMIAKSQGNTVVKKGAKEVIIKECSPGETSTSSDSCTYACCNENSECELNGCTNTDTVTIECTNYTWEDKKANATCTDECVLEDEKVCHDGNVWWQDSCGSFTEKVKDCDTYSNSTCSNGQCVCNADDCSSYECGTHDDGCGGTINCGSCCTDQCTSGKERCNNNNVEECKDTNGDGCTEWAVKENCTYCCDSYYQWWGFGQKVTSCEGECHSGETDPCSDTCWYQKCVGDYCKYVKGDTDYGSKSCGNDCYWNSCDAYASCPADKCSYDSDCVSCTDECGTAGNTWCSSGNVYKCVEKSDGCNDKVKQKSCNTTGSCTCENAECKGPWGWGNSPINGSWDRNCDGSVEMEYSSTWITNNSCLVGVIDCPPGWDDGGRPSCGESQKWTWDYGDCFWIGCKYWNWGTRTQSCR